MEYLNKPVLFCVGILLSFSVFQKSRRSIWIRVVSVLALAIGVVGVLGAEGVIGVNLYPVREQLGPLGEVLIYWDALVFMAFGWVVILLLLSLYFRLRDASVGKPDAED